jgi:predicted tellurium resistance membrane protein TerC
MSLDNVLAVVRNDVTLLVVGPLGGFLARPLDRFKIIAHVEVALIAWIGLELVWAGLQNTNHVLALGQRIPVPHDAGAPPQ